jgi:D-psicose/D-tagatose/L-ribulose 3-epimerase
MKYFRSPENTPKQEVRDLLNWWNSRGIEITGMQGLLFGLSHLNLFSDHETRRTLISHFISIFEIAATLGARALVFGSPKNRNRLDLTDDQVLGVAISFFEELGELAISRGLIICLEPNPVEYGANFMVTNRETASVVRAIDHPAVRMQYDTGAAQMTGETSELEFEETVDIIGHIHISEPGIAPIGTGETNHQHFSTMFLKAWPNRLATIEMLSSTENPESTIENAIQETLSIYDPSWSHGRGR